MQMWQMGSGGPQPSYLLPAQQVCQSGRPLKKLRLLSLHHSSSGLFLFRSPTPFPKASVCIRSVYLGNQPQRDQNDRQEAVHDSLDIDSQARPAYRIQRRGGGQGPNFQNFSNIIRVSPLCENRDLRFRGGGAWPPVSGPVLKSYLFPKYTGAWNWSHGALPRTRVAQFHDRRETPIFCSFPIKRGFVVTPFPPAPGIH